MSNPKTKVIELFEQNKDIAEIAEETQLPISDIERYLDSHFSKKLEAALLAQAKEQEPVEDALLIDETGQIVTTAAAKEQMRTMGGEDFRDAARGIAILDQELRISAGVILRGIQTKVNCDLTAKELSQLSASIATLQNAFFNKQTTNFNFANFGSDSPESKLMEDFKKRLKS